MTLDLKCSPASHIAPPLSAVHPPYCTAPKLVNTVISSQLPAFSQMSWVYPRVFVVHRSDSHWSDDNKAILFRSFLMLPLCPFQHTYSSRSLDETRKMDTLVHLYWYNIMPVWAIYEGQTGICFLRMVDSGRSKFQVLLSAWTLLKEERQKRTCFSSPCGRNTDDSKSLLWSA